MNIAPTLVAAHACGGTLPHSKQTGAHFSVRRPGGKTSAPTLVALNR